MPPFVERVDFLTGKTGFVGSWDVGPVLFSENMGAAASFEDND